MVTLKTLFSGISPGTECLVGRAEVPLSARAHMACMGMSGSFELPVKYGYCCVAELMEASAKAPSRRAFLMHPHQSHIRVRAEQLQWIPDSVPSRRALLFPNLETALNGVWDAPPLSGEAKGATTCVVFGAGLVGLLVSFVLHKQPPTATGPNIAYQAPPSQVAPRIIVVESHPERRRRALSLPWVTEAVAPSALEMGQASTAWHTTATSEGLQAALDAVGFEGTVVDLSWYGMRKVTLELGSSFHWERKRIISSQVAQVAPQMRDQLGYSGRRKAVWELLQSPELDLLLSPDIPFAQLPNYMAQLYAGARPHALPVIRY